MPIYQTCPHCGAHLDPGERCSCQDSPTAAADRTPEIDDCLRLREIRQSTGAMAKDAALVAQDIFPKFNRQLLAQCEAWDKYGVIIHPEALGVICAAYGVSLPDKAVITAPKARNKPKRRLARKLTFRMTTDDYSLLEQRVKESGCRSSQEWLYRVVQNALKGEKHG